MEQHICLIGGTGRSGTTILQRIFARHPDVADVQEWRFLIDPDGIIDFYTTCQLWSPYHYDLKLKRLESLLKKVGTRHPLERCYVFLQKIGLVQTISWLMNTEYIGINATAYCPRFREFAKNLLERLTAFRYAGYWTGMNRGWTPEMRYGSFPEEERLVAILGDFLRQVIHDVLEHQQVTHYLEKNTWNILWFDKILNLLPEARLVHIYRDPRDVAASYMKQSWMPSHPEQCAQMYHDIITRWWQIRKNVPSESVFELALESLAAGPEHMLHNLCDFWGIPWHDSLLEIPLSKTHTGRWKQDFDAQQQQQIQRILQPQLDMMGYE